MKSTLHPPSPQDSFCQVGSCSSLAVARTSAQNAHLAGGADLLFRAPAVASRTAIGPQQATTIHIAKMTLKTFAHIGGGRDLTIEEQGQFYDTMKSSIWVLKVGKGSDERVASGLCISNKGYILTTSCVVGKTNDTIFGREVNSNSFQQLKIIKRGDSMLILEPMKVKKEGYDYAAISDNSVQVSECQEVYCIDHIGSGVYSFVVGEVSHRRRVIDDIVHLQVANIHTTGHSDIVFSSTGHLMGIVLRKLSNKGNRKDPDVDVGHNLVLHFSEINKFLKTFRPRASKSVK